MDVVEELIWLSRKLGDPSYDLAILAEGNASARGESDTFWVKASGHQLESLTLEGLSWVELQSALSVLDSDLENDQAIRDALRSICRNDPLPSVETFMHAYLLSLPGVDFVGHTHPTSVLALCCLEAAPELATQRLFPDEIVCCGPESVYVPYVDPGLPLANSIRLKVEEFIHRRGETPRTIWLANHGLIAIGKTPNEVLASHRMAEKAARVWLGALSANRPLQTLTTEQIARIHTRPDEHYRQELLRQLTKK